MFLNPRNPAELEEAVLQRIPSITGMELEHWHTLMVEEGPEDLTALHDWLQDEKGLNYIQAKLLIQSAVESSQLVLSH